MQTRIGKRIGIRKGKIIESKEKMRKKIKKNKNKVKEKRKIGLK